MLYFSVLMCAIGAATQGWDQTGSNGASESSQYLQPPNVIDNQTYLSPPSLVSLLPSTNPEERPTR
jgi:hypothetical protein